MVADRAARLEVLELLARQQARDVAEGALELVLLVAIEHARGLYRRGQAAPRRKFRDTEVWLMIRGLRDAPGIGLPKDHLQRLIGQALAGSYFRHARIAAYIADAMWAVALLMWAAHKLRDGGPGRTRTCNQTVMSGRL